ncbi:MAG: hypothetical protein KatS3mg022_2688 [Armatimonadota bacterium]|nr:MAG: hypothetical protein KatS3mg022_2688 [Armatimonadota bacterium]
MRLRRFLVWTAAGLFVANVFALPHTLAALGVHAGGGTDPASLLLNSGCGCGGSGSFGEGVRSVLPAVFAKPYLLFTPSKLHPLIKTCIDLWEECTSAPVLTQERTERVSWPDSCYNQGGYKKYKRSKYRWNCGDCYVVRCCPWTPAGCWSSLIPTPTCQGNDAPCPLPPCVEPPVNCN